MKKVTENQVLKNPKYRGMHVILAAGEVYATKDDDNVSMLLEKARKEHPRAIPFVAYLPPKNLILTL